MTASLTASPLPAQSIQSNKAESLKNKPRLDPMDPEFTQELMRGFIKARNKAIDMHAAAKQQQSTRG